MHLVKAALALGALLVGFRVGVDIGRRYLSGVTPVASA